MFAPGDAVVRIASASSYSFGVRPVHETAVLHDDIPLCPLATIQQSIEKLIFSGHLRSVHSLRFGLVAYNDPDSADGIIAMPAWVVREIEINGIKVEDHRHARVGGQGQLLPQPGRV